MRRLATVTFAALFLGLILVACDSTEPEARGTVQGVVLIEGLPVPGVTVELSGPSSRSTVTDEAGRYAFSEIPGGAYFVSITGFPEDAAFDATSRPAVISDGGSVTVDFQGLFIRTASISGTVTSAGQGLPGVAVTLRGATDATLQTDASGSFAFQALRAGSYEVEISGFPSTVSFPSTRSTVDLGTGQAHVVTFEGSPELTATLVVKTVNRRLPDGGTEPADLQNLHGRIDVIVTLDRGEDTPDSILVLLGGQVVGKQSFQPDEAPGPSGPSAAAPLDISFAVNTAAFDSATGEPAFMNGERVLSARLATREGGPTAWTASVPVVLRNQDTFTSRVEPERGPVTGEDDEHWIGGDVLVVVLPVVYSPDREISSVTVALRRTGGGEIARRAVGGTPPLDALFPASGTSQASLAGYQTPASATDEFRVVQGGYADGTPVPGLPAVVATGLRIDQVPPASTPFRLPRQDAETACCLENWVGGDLVFEEGLGPREDAGAGMGPVRVHAGPASLADPELLSLPPVTRGSDLEETETNSAYRALAVLEDLVGNVRIVPLEPSPGNPLSGNGGAVFGVDLSPPEVALDDGGAGLGPRAVNPPSESSWLLRVEETPSGFGPLPARATVRRLAPGVGGADACPFPGTSSCEPAPDALLRSVPDGPPGYYRYRARVLDRAGNLSGPVEAAVLRDTTPPEIPSFQIPSELEGGQERTFAGEAEDDVDLHLAQVSLAFRADPSGSATVRLPFAPPDTLGRPFGEILSTRASFQVRFPFVHGLELASAGTASDAPDGQLMRARSARARIWDAAGNTAQATAQFPDPAAFPALSFQVSERGAEGGVAGWRLSAAGPTVCRQGTPDCAAPGSVVLEARARGEGGALAAPFAAVHFLAMEVGGEARWLGRATLAEMVQDDAGAEGRHWAWTLDWTPDPRVPLGEQSLVAVGVDADGNALRSPVLTSVTVVGVSSPGGS